VSPVLALSINPLEHVKDSALFEGLGGSLERIGEGLAYYGVTKQVFLFVLAGVITVALFLWQARRAQRETLPRGFANFIETVMLFVRDQMVRPFMGESGDRYLPMIWSFFFFIAISNLLGMVPLFDFLGHGGNTPTGSLWLTASLAICSFVLYHGLGIKEQGFLHYLKNLFPRVPWLIYIVIIPVEILAHIVRPCALAIRLFANMLAGHTMIATIIGFTAVWVNWLHWGAAISLVSFLGCVALTFLELLVAIIQAFVFTFLTTVFLAGAVHPEH
jgi:F-type H+-transporting ATPase subunit a